MKKIFFTPCIIDEIKNKKIEKFSFLLNFLKNTQKKIKNNEKNFSPRA